jgi:hypothetical protein
MSNRRKIKPRGASGQPLPECADCHSTTIITAEDDGVHIHVEHDSRCPSWLGVTPSAAKAFALAEARTGRVVLYAKDRAP